MTRFYPSRQERRNKLTSWRTSPPNMRCKWHSLVCVWCGFDECISLKRVSLQTVLWQPVSPQHIWEEIQVHLFVPAHSSETVVATLQNHNMIYEWATHPGRFLCILMCLTRDCSCDSVLGFCWTMQMSWLKCRRGMTRPTHGAAWVSMKNITIWKK